MSPRKCFAHVCSFAALIAALVLSPIGVAQAGTPRCHGKEATIVGGPGAQTLTGTNRDDVIVGLEGPDRIFGRGGADTICGGEGNDKLYGENGRDLVDGGEHSDRLNGGRGSDRLIGPNMFLDTVSYRDSPGSIDADLGAGRVTAPDGNDVLVRAHSIIGSLYSDRIEGSRGHDILRGRGGRDVLRGLGSGDDLEGGVGRDRLIGGGEGNDFGPNVAIYQRARSRVRVDLENGRVTGGHGRDVLRNIDGVIGSNYGDLLLGDEDANELIDTFGPAGRDDDDNDVLRGKGGPDRLAVSEGSDEAFGGGGTDEVRDLGEADDPNATDRLEGGRGRDLVHADFGDDDPTRTCCLGGTGTTSWNGSARSAVASRSREAFECSVATATTRSWEAQTTIVSSVATGTITRTAIWASTPVRPRPRSGARPTPDPAECMMRCAMRTYGCTRRPES